MSATSTNGARGGARSTTAQPTRLKILEGAATAFGEGGFAGTTVADILAASGVSRPSFYKFFRNKDEVFDLLHETHMLSLIQLVKGAARSVADPDAKIDHAAEAYLRWIAAIGPLAEALYTESRRPGSRLSERYREAIATLTDFFEQQAAELDIRGVDPLVFTGLVAACESVGVSLMQASGAGEVNVERGKAAIGLLVRNALSNLNGGPETT